MCKMEILKAFAILVIALGSFCPDIAAMRRNGNSRYIGYCLFRALVSLSAIAFYAKL